MSGNYYAIVNGRERFNGVVDNWEQAKLWITAVSGAKYKKFRNYYEAQDFVEKHTSPEEKAPLSKASQAISEAFLKARQPLQASRFLDQHVDYIVDAINAGKTMVQLLIDEAAYRASEGNRSIFEGELLNSNPHFRSVHVGHQDARYYVEIHFSE